MENAEWTNIKPILRYLRRSHLSRAILAVLQTCVEVREALHRHRQMLRDFVQTQETCLRYVVGFEIFVDLRSHGAADWKVEGGECIERGLSSWLSVGSIV